MPKVVEKFSAAKGKVGHSVRKYAVLSILALNVFNPFKTMAQDTNQDNFDEAQYGDYDPTLLDNIRGFMGVGDWYVAVLVGVGALAGLGLGRATKKGSRQLKREAAVAKKGKEEAEEQAARVIKLFDDALHLSQDKNSNYEIVLLTKEQYDEVLRKNKQGLEVYVDSEGKMEILGSISQDVDQLGDTQAKKIKQQVIKKLVSKGK